jgi:hypothetical protein
MRVLLIAYALFSVSFILFYSFCAGLTTVWLHNYLVGTSKSSEYSHDHRMCKWSSMLWPLILIVLAILYSGKTIKFVYSYPAKIYADTKNMQAKITKKQ